MKSEDGKKTWGITKWYYQSATRENQGKARFLAFVAENNLELPPFNPKLLNGTVYNSTYPLIDQRNPLCTYALFSLRAAD